MYIKRRRCRIGPCGTPDKTQALEQRVTDVDTYTENGLLSSYTTNIGEQGGSDLTGLYSFKERFMKDKILGYRNIEAY